MKRRHFIVLSASASGALFLSQCSQFASQSSSSTAATRFVSQGGLLEADLTAALSSVMMGDRTRQVMTYNGQTPGPILEARPGDTVRIRFTNQLPDPTNLHYHGLHIPPTGTADNVFLSVPTGESFTYEFTLPADHPAGTFWYHPHYHGKVAEQVFGGLAGLFVVRGELDEIPEIQAAHEEFLVLKDFEFDDRDRIPTPQHMFQMWGREGSLLTVNGQVRPSFTIPQDGLLRLRILNASSSRFYKLAIPNHTMHLIATDGGALEAPVEMDDLLLAPGERAEVLIQGNAEPGEYQLLNLPYDRGLFTMMRGMAGDETIGTEPDVLATLTYGDRQPASLPTALIPVESLPEPVRTRSFSLNHGMGRRSDMNHGMGPGMMGGGMDMLFLINGKAFEHSRVDTAVNLGDVEEWEIRNTGGMDHPFHIHVNHFQVISRNGVPEPYRAWKDTVLVAFQETVRIRVPFRQFAGRTVYHCHILDHEDKGMMGILDINA
jgi:FtsP/CotA-like multicopper oxidase with cupredoxin domain